MKSILPFPLFHFSRGEGAVQLRHRRQHPGPDGHVAQGQQARGRRPRRQGQGETIKRIRTFSTLKWDTTI